MNRKGQIIIIEDDHDDQQILKEIFQELGVTNSLVFLEDGDAAYNYLMSMPEKPFLIICDINLPKVNGVELKQKIDTTDYLRRKAVPFVFLTTSDEEATVDDAYRVTNLQGYFKKASSMQEIKQRVKLILDYWTEAVHPKSK
jgi:CheY-like chemotaxis protein